MINLVFNLTWLSNQAIILNIGVPCQAVWTMRGWMKGLSHNNK
jgi:hypothetical protein